MSLSDSHVAKLIEEVKRRMGVAANMPFRVAIMGQTGVGKSSLINALFGTNLKTDPVRPCTKRPEKNVFKGKSGSELWFYDMPGIGESDRMDNNYLADYKEQLVESDVILWAIHADMRSVSFDLQTLNSLLGSDLDEQARLMSKITFVLTKADLLVPPPWIFAKSSDYGVFVPGEQTKVLLEQKTAYFQELFIRPYAERMVSQTYNDGGFDISDASLSYDEYTIFYRGLLDKNKVTTLKQKYPHYAAVFERLYHNYQVIPCSALFKFNLNQLMLVMINRLGADAVERFSNFMINDALNAVAVSDAKKLCNIVVFDKEINRIVFDLSRQDT